MVRFTKVRSHSKWALPHTEVAEFLITGNATCVCVTQGTEWEKTDDGDDGGRNNEGERCYACKPSTANLNTAAILLTGYGPLNSRWFGFISTRDVFLLSIHVARFNW